MIKTTKRNILIASALAVTMVSGAAVAEEKEFDFGKIYVECGLGGMIGSAVEHKTTSQVLAVVTNVTWDLGTTASTSYFTSEDTCYNQKARTAAFINQSYENLEKEIASGQGEYFDALANLARDEQQSISDYQANLRNKFALIVADDSYTQLSRYEKVQKLYEVAI
jgi:hypothetical protein